MSFLLASAARATVGARSGQEDAFRVWPAEGPLRPKASGDGLLAVLADGMGGHAGGAVAGQTACAMFTEVFVADGAPYEERLKSALQASNEALAKGVEQNSALRGMGCTLVAAWIDKSGLRWTSVGDSLLLLYRFPDVIRLNADHSLGSYLDEQVRQNRITASEARAAPNRNALRSALTGSKIDLIDLHGEPLDLHPGDWILLASDGIGSLAGDELADVIYRYRQSTPEEMADGLVGAVARKGVPEQDNTTVVAVRVEGTSQISTSRLTTRILRPGAASPGGAPDKKRGRSILSSALEVSPAVWLGAAAGLLVIAIFLAVRMLPSSAPSAPSAPSANLPVLPRGPSPPPQGSSGPTEPQAPEPPRSPPPYPPSGPPEASIPPVVSPPAPPAVRGAPKPESPSSGRPSGGTPDRSGPRTVGPKEATPGPGAPPSSSAPPGVESIVPPGSVPAPVPNRPPPPEGPEQPPKSNKGADSAKELGKELGNQ